MRFFYEKKKKKKISVGVTKERKKQRETQLVLPIPNGKHLVRVRLGDAGAGGAVARQGVTVARPAREGVKVVVVYYDRFF